MSAWYVFLFSFLFFSHSMLTSRASADTLKLYATAHGHKVRFILASSLPAFPLLPPSLNFPLLRQLHPVNGISADLSHPPGRP